MSRPLRIQYPGAWYHVMNRGRRGESVFVDKGDYAIFVELLKEVVDMYKMRVAAYCLIPNHYHLLLQTPGGDLSRCMRHVNGIYTQRFNRTHHCDGQLFRGRYKSILVDGDSYLLELVRYIHRNPLKAGLAKKLSDYEWSSHRAYLGQINIPRQVTLPVCRDRTPALAAAIGERFFVRPGTVADLARRARELTRTNDVAVACESKLERRVGEIIGHSKACPLCPLTPLPSRIFRALVFDSPRARFD